MNDETTPWVWRPLALPQLDALFAELDAHWILAGGHALERYLGRPIRDHDDIDVVVFADELPSIVQYLDERDWEVHVADPPGQLRPWPGALPEGAHDLWCRPRSESAWALQLMVERREEDTWIYRRDDRIRRGLSDICWEDDGGRRVLAPEVQLLYKSKDIRPKDQVDCEVVRPLLGPEASWWLRTVLRIVYAQGHPWLGD